MLDLQAARAEELLDRMSRVRVLVVGDIMLDVYLRGGATRISPEAPVPVVHVGDEWRAPGGAANVAANVAALGGASRLVGVVGMDGAGLEFQQVCDELGIDGAGVHLVPDRPTTVKTRVLVGHQQVARYDREREDDLSSADAEAVRSWIERLAPDADAIILEDYDKGVMVPAVIEAGLEWGRRLDVPVVVDPKAKRFFRYTGATVFKPNAGELATALRTETDTDSAEWMERTRDQLKCQHLLVTLGPHGMALMPGSGGSLVHVPSIARSVYDVSGAGDTVTAVMATALAAGAAVEEAAVLATHAAGIEVGKAGVATVTPDEIMESVRELERAQRA